MGIITRYGRTIDTLPQGNFFGPPQDWSGAINSVVTPTNPILVANAEPTEMSVSTTLSDGTAYFCPLYIPEPMTLTGLVILLQVSGVFVADNNNYLRLYKMVGRAAVLVASTANDSSVFSASVGYSFAPFTSTYDADEGYYVVTVLNNRASQTTSPVLGGMLGSSSFANWGMNDILATPYSATAQAFLPGTFSKLDGAAAGLTAASVNLWVGAY